MFIFLGNIIDKAVVWFFDFFIRLQSHEIQFFLWNVFASVTVVLLIETVRRPLVSFDRNLISKDTSWKKGKLWLARLCIKNGLKSQLFFGYSVNNLKLFCEVFDEKFNQQIKFQMICDSNPDPFEAIEKSNVFRGINLARGESENFSLVIKTNNGEFYKGTGIDPVPGDYWYLPSYESLAEFNHKENSSEPAIDNKFVLKDGFYYLKISILSDQIISKKWFKLSLKNNKAFLYKLNIFEQIKK